MWFAPSAALIVVDVQNDFADPAGSLYVAGGEQVVGFINAQIALARKAGAFVVYTRDWHPPTTPHFAKDGGIWPVHCVAESWGAEFHPGLEIAGPSVLKGVAGEDGYSGFTERDPRSGAETATALTDMLRDRDITEAVVLGLATDYCVKETAVDATHLGLATVLLADGVRPVNLKPGDGARAVAAMVAAGVTVA